MAFHNPFAFTSRPVIFFTTVTYVALLAALLFTHLTVPSYPAKTPPGTNLTEAWHDLEHITRWFHPYNSHANDHVRAYLLARIQHVIASKKLSAEQQVEILDDNVANATFSSRGTSVYFEGTNIMVVIRGSEDNEAFTADRSPENGGVLVNAHYDSVSSGYGATDDGVGVVTILQLLSFFTQGENWPKRTVVLLLNNGEEDFLNGAKAFMRNNISQIPHTFVNLEGAGAGGRATLFRSTDTEVTRFYRTANAPFGTVVSSDGFKKGLIRSETDYKVFYGELGLRGLDIAFMEPRARYHTVEDSTRETTLNSVWHMLSAALAASSGLAADTSSTFDMPKRDSFGDETVSPSSDAVWFDIFGSIFIVFQLHTLFALSVTMLVVSPLTMIALTLGLSKRGKNYLFARKAYVYSADDDQSVPLDGWRGFFRFPITFAIATAAVVSLAYLQVRVNPYIVYSSPYAVWSMMLSAWFVIAWALSRAADALRPSALQRMYCLIWLFMGTFALLVFVTVLAHNHQIAAGYPALFYFAVVSAALFLSYLEMFCAPTKAAYAQHLGPAVSRRGSGSGSRSLTGTANATRADVRTVADDEATETTSLLRGDRRSFAQYGGSRRESVSGRAGNDEAELRPFELGHAHAGEQGWSGKLPSWIWILQFLLLAPMVIVLVGQIALLLTSGLHQTPSDGNAPLFIYLAFAALSVLLLAPIAPFLHRFTHQIPVFLFLVCVATVIYNQVAFPFSREHRLKVYFVQRVDCETAANVVSLTGLDGYVQRIVGNLPSAQGKQVICRAPAAAMRKELTVCEWEGLAAEVVPQAAAAAASPPFSNNTSPHTSHWLDYQIHKQDPNHNNNSSANHRATIRLLGQNTRACRIAFDSPILDLAVAGGVSDARFSRVGPQGSQEVRLWHREWTRPWDVSVSWDASQHSKLSGRVICLWSDANAGEIPAFDEVQHYMPVWAIPSKFSDGLVEGSKYFEI